MINKLINMNVQYRNKPIKINNTGTYSIEDYAIAFIKGMGDTQRQRFKSMLSNGIKCGMSAALNYGIEYEPFILEVKKQLEV